MSDEQTDKQAEHAIKIHQILYPTDFSDQNLYALKYACDFARKHGATLHCLHVVDEAYQYLAGMGPDSIAIGPPPEDLVNATWSQMTAFVGTHLSGMPFPVKTAVVLGRPFIEIIRYARENEIDLIVIATHGRSGLKHVLMGSVAEKVVRKAPCPVLTIRHPDQEFVMP
jgi:universal stress protein A